MILLDCSPRKICVYRERWSYAFGQLRTPLTQYRITGKDFEGKPVPYALDNGCFTDFKRDTWEGMLRDAEEHRPLFVTLPDIVGDALRTLELFDEFELMTNGLPRALVLQDGIGSHRIPWPKIDAVFVGGSDNFKFSAEALNACKAAKFLGKWVHVGRVNTAHRVRNWLGLADSIDGSGISRYDHMLEDVLAQIRGQKPQQELLS